MKTCIYIYAYTRIYIYMYIGTFFHFLLTYVYRYLSIYVYRYTDSIYISACMGVCMCIFQYAYLHTSYYINKKINTYICIHTYMYALSQTRFRRPDPGQLTRLSPGPSMQSVVQNAMKASEPPIGTPAPASAAGAAACAHIRVRCMHIYICIHLCIYLYL